MMLCHLLESRKIDVKIGTRHLTFGSIPIQLVQLSANEPQFTRAMV
jgi:hypothetical protein